MDEQDIGWRNGCGADEDFGSEIEQMRICKSNVTPFVVQNLVKVGPVPKKRAF